MNSLSLTRVRAGFAALLAAGLAACVSDSGQSSSSIEGEESTSGADGGSDAVCQPMVTTMLGSNDEVIGDVSIIADDTTLTVTTTVTAEKMFLRDMYLMATTGEIPLSADGHVDTWSFPFKATFSPPYPLLHTFTVALADLGIAAGSCDAINIILYARLRVVDDGGVVIAVRDGFAQGPNDCPESDDQGCNCSWMTYDQCCRIEPPPPPDEDDDGCDCVDEGCEEGEEDCDECDDECKPDVEEKGCTLTQGYWKNHNEFETKPNRKVDWPAPYDEGDLLCTMKSLDILHMSSAGGDAWLILARQFIAARLNIANGASSTPEVDAAIAEATELLAANCDEMPTTEIRSRAIELAGLLDGYNNGAVGPGHCD